MADGAPARCSSPSNWPATARSPFTCPALDASARTHVTPSPNWLPCSASNSSCFSSAPRRPASTTPRASPCPSQTTQPRASAPKPPVTKYRSPSGPSAASSRTPLPPLPTCVITGVYLMPPRYAASYVVAPHFSSPGPTATSASTSSTVSTSTLTQFSSGCSTRATRPTPHSAAWPASTSSPARVRTPLLDTTTSFFRRSPASLCSPSTSSAAACALSPRPSFSLPNPSHTTTNAVPGFLSPTFAPRSRSIASITLLPRPPPSTITVSSSALFPVRFCCPPTSRPASRHSTPYMGTSASVLIGSTQKRRRSNAYVGPTCALLVRPARSNSRSSSRAPSSGTDPLSPRTISFVSPSRLSAFSNATSSFAVEPYTVKLLSNTDRPVHVSAHISQAASPRLRRALAYASAIFHSPPAVLAASRSPTSLRSRACRSASAARSPPPKIMCAFVPLNPNELTPP